MTETGDPGATGAKWPVPPGAGFFDNPKSILILVFGMEIFSILFGVVPLAPLVILAVAIGLAFVARSRLSGNPFRANANLAWYTSAFGMLPLPLMGSAAFALLVVLVFEGFALAGLIFTLMDRSTERWTPTLGRGRNWARKRCTDLPIGEIDSNSPRGSSDFLI